MAGIVDADTHILEPREMWDFFDKELVSQRPTVVAGPSRLHWLIDGLLFPNAGGKHGANLATPVSDEARAQRPDVGARELLDISYRLGDMDTMGVETKVVYPTLFLAFLTEDAGLDVALAQAYNRFLGQAYEKSGGRIRWVAIPPLRNVQATVDELQWAKKHGAVGVFFRGLEDDLSLDDPYFFPVYEEAEKVDLPICIHASVGNFNMWDQQENGLRFKLPPISVFHNLIMRRVPERFPDLRWCFVEISAQWVPYALNDLSIRFGNSGREFAGAALMRENRMYVACQTTDDLEYVIENAGDDNIIIGTDYGHDDTSSEILAMQRLREEGKLPPDTVRKILDDNPRRLYAL